MHWLSALLAQEGYQVKNYRDEENAIRGTGIFTWSMRYGEETARSEQNLMAAVLEAVKAYATVGEISDALRRVFGEYQESVVI